MSAEIPYVIGAYAITWIVLAAYALYLARLGRRVRTQVAALECD